jgi:histidinol-phosphate aminotransferase
MYKVSARINNIKVMEVLLDENFDLDVKKIIQSITPQTKLIFLCSPNNPTGNALSRDGIKKLLNEFTGLVVVDEAYIDFADEPSITTWLNEFQNLVVLQTLSKAWGLASIRVGLCLANHEIISLLDKIKPPYNISGPNQLQAIHALDSAAQTKERIAAIKTQRDSLKAGLSKIKFIEKIFPSQGNFLLVSMHHANTIYHYLSQNGIIVRNRSKEPGCENCLRITVGTETENKILIEKLKSFEETEASGIKMRQAKVISDKI